jgi:hypothetical protein
MKTTKRLVTLLMVGVTFIYAGSSCAESAQKVTPKASYQQGFCDKYQMAEDTVDVDTIFEDIDASPYASAMEEFWTAPVCDAPQKLSSKVPIIFNTAHNVTQAENFPQAVREYLLEVKKDTTTWLKIINSKSSDGYTFLDFMQYNISYENYRLQESKDAAQRIVQYLCQNGGVYSKYKDTVKCP